jgi:hypothetical protein
MYRTAPTHIAAAIIAKTNSRATRMAVIILKLKFILGFSGIR